MADTAARARDDGQPARAPEAARTACCGRGPGDHAGYCDQRHAGRIWASTAVTAARAFLRDADAARADINGDPGLDIRPLSGHLRAVLTEIDQASGATP